MRPGWVRGEALSELRDPGQGGGGQQTRGGVRHGASEDLQTRDQDAAKTGASYRVRPGASRGLQVVKDNAGQKDAAGYPKLVLRLPFTRPRYRERGFRRIQY